MKYDVIVNILESLFAEKYEDIFDYLNNKKTNKVRYSNNKIREAYELFAGSRILADAYYELSKLISEYNLYPLNILDLGIGEGLMWKKVFFYINRDQLKHINLTGVDYSKNGLNKVLANISTYKLNHINLIKSNIKKFNFENKYLKNQWLISCLTLHHLKYKDKLGIIRRAIQNGIRRISIIEVDYDLEGIKDDYLRAYSAALLYRDVFDSIKYETGEEASKEILRRFYYDELISIMNSSYLSLEERYISLIDWYKIMISYGLQVNLMERTYSGVNNIYHIGILDVSI